MRHVQELTLQCSVYEVGGGAGGRVRVQEGRPIGKTPQWLAGKMDSGPS